MQVCQAKKGHHIGLYVFCETPFFMLMKAEVVDLICIYVLNKLAVLLFVSNPNNKQINWDSYLL